MSKYKVINALLNDGEALLKALNDLQRTGVNGRPFVFERHENPVALIGYQGDTRPEKAHIVVRRQYVGSMSNDFGLKRNADGSYEAIISEYDQHQSRGIGILNAIKQRYAYHRLTKLAAGKGYTYSEEAQTDGSIKMVLRQAVRA